MICSTLVEGINVIYNYVNQFILIVKVLLLSEVLTCSQIGIYRTYPNTKNVLVHNFSRKCESIFTTSYFYESAHVIKSELNLQI